jgi:hypothetical protein
MIGKIDKDTVILDYGCGVGRLAKALIENTTVSWWGGPNRIHADVCD